MPAGRDKDERYATMSVQAQRNSSWKTMESRDGMRDTIEQRIREELPCPMAAAGECRNKDCRRCAFRRIEFEDIA